MKRIKLTAVFLAAAVCASALPISAAGFITVSDWAYTQVSAFREAGFMPETMEDVTDYTENATRGQFAELVYSMITRFDYIDDYTGIAAFTDTDNAKISTLAELGILSGVSDTEFMPDSTITREAAAAALYRAAIWCDNSGRFSSLASDAAEQYEDYSEISDWARDAVNAFCGSGIMIGSDNKFNPKDNITIEQAILTISRACDYLPTFSDTTPDGGVPSAYDEEEYENGFILEDFANGYYKIRKGDEILITYGDSVDTSETVFAFGVDTYRSVSLAEADDTVYAFAMTYKDTTYVYNAENQELLYSIPCTGVTRALDDYFVVYKTVASENGANRLYGVYAYDGTEIEEIKYSLTDLIAMGYKPHSVSVSGSSSASAGSSSSGTTAFGGGRGDGSVNEYTNSDGDLLYNGTYIITYEANGYQVAHIGPEPLIYKGETVLIPVIDFAGIMLDWDYTLDSLISDDRTAAFTKDGKTVKITAGTSTAVGADGNDYVLEYPAMLIEESGEDDIYISYTDFAELFGYESAVWDADNKLVELYEAGYSQ
ncbi:MAG: S-layer homology domain-containing protein [Firmicutes bacterium]|nr:S-layer homology domain-containing protein [Bacillota bacterium]